MVCEELYSIWPCYEPYIVWPGKLFTIRECCITRKLVCDSCYSISWLWCIKKFESYVIWNIRRGKKQILFKLGKAQQPCTDPFVICYSTCEICGSIAHNVTGTYEADSTEQRNEPNEATTATATAAIVMPPHSTEARNFWQGHRFLNFLLACMVFAFVISWLFHFKIPS